MTATRLAWPLVALAVVFVTMAAEARLSSANERVLLARGARLVTDASYPWMRIAYPLGFVAIAVEGLYRGAAWNGWAAAGLTIYAAGKLVKYAAIAALGVRWSFRVLVLPDAPLVTHGPYRFVRHPNYLGVVGEIVGLAVWLQAPIAGTLCGVTFGLILLWRIRIEARALGLDSRA